MLYRLVAAFVIALLLGGGSSVGAGAALPAFERVAETDHARFYSTRALKVDVRRSEAFLGRLFALFGLASGERRVEYYRYASLEDLRSDVGIAAYGVTNLDSLRIDSVREYHPHELVHAVAGRLGRPPLLFTEGLAVALTSEGQWRGRDIDEIARAYVRSNRSIDPLLSDFGAEDPDRDYALAASFVAFLLDRDGIDPFLAFLRGCGAAPEAYEQAFVRAYGRGVRNLGVEWEMTLLSGSSAHRAWYDSKEWPRALPRTVARVALADAGPEPGPATVPGGTRQVLLSVGP
jgi:hypothetical protein